MTSATWTALAFVLYLAAAVCFGAVLFLRSPAAPHRPHPPAPSSSQGEGEPEEGAYTLTEGISRLGLLLLLGGILVHFAAIGAWCVTTHRSPFASEFGTFSVLAWAIALAYAIFDFRARLPAVGAVALSVACIILFWGVAHARGPIEDNPVLKSQLVSMHVLAILASFGLLALAFGCAALYLLQHRLLKSHRVGGLFRRLPSLQTLDTVAYHSVAYALPLLTLGLLLGLVEVFSGRLSSPPSAWLRDAHTIASGVTWLLYVFYLAARLGAGWRGVRLQYILLAGLFVALALYAVPTSTHRFH
ncbi:MAG TPA: cytochrome c biogenesis protein CcsA [Chthonomonadaceae bacterium]|nr:cytochrome c biogenesis protein CcsA [Chthonomonadaceae bacterium]